MAKMDVVIPCYNYGRFLEQCVDSVLNHSVCDVRILIIDDASSDNSASVARELAAKYRTVEARIHSTNAGHIKTYNEGIDWAESDYFLLLSADDMLVARALDRAVAVMDDNPDVVLTFGECIPWHDTDPLPDLAPVQQYTWERCELLRKMCATASNFVPTPTAVVRTSVQKAIGGYRASLPHTGDMEMWLRFAANGSVARIDTIQAIYRKHGSAMSNAYFADMLSDYRQRQQAFNSFFNEYANRLEDVARLQLTARQALAQVVFDGGIGLLRRGRLYEGIRHMRESMELDHRLRYRPPLWRLMRLPGTEGRERALRIIKEAAGRVSNRAAQLGRT